MKRIAFHFINADWTTSTGGLTVKVGETLKHTGPMKPCVAGLHASVRAIDALKYAQGPVVTLVACAVDFIDHGAPADKFVCRERKALWGYDCSEELWAFARLVALDALQFRPDAPMVVRDFLETGDEGLRSAARAASSAASSATYAAWSAASSATHAASSAASSATYAAWSAQNEMLEALLFDGAVSRGLVKP